MVLLGKVFVEHKMGDLGGVFHYEVGVLLLQLASWFVLEGDLSVRVWDAFLGVFRAALCSIILVLSGLDVLPTYWLFFEQMVHSNR